LEYKTYEQRVECSVGRGVVAVVEAAAVVDTSLVAVVEAVAVDTSLVAVVEAVDTSLVAVVEAAAVVDTSLAAAAYDTSRVADDAVVDRPDADAAVVDKPAVEEPV